MDTAKSPGEEDVCGDDSVALKTGQKMKQPPAAMILLN
jgi:hypothetical protein